MGLTRASNALLSGVEDKLMTQNVSNDNNNHPLLLCPTADANTNQGDKIGVFSGNVTANPNKGTVTANNYLGNTIAVSASNIDVSSGACFTKTISANTTFTFSGVTENKCATFSLILENGGAYTVTWPSNVKWSNNEVPELIESGFDVLTFLTVDGGSTWYGVVSCNQIPGLKKLIKINFYKYGQSGSENVAELVSTYSKPTALLDGTTLQLTDVLKGTNGETLNLDDINLTNYSIGMQVSVEQYNLTNTNNFDYYTIVGSNVESQSDYQSWTYTTSSGSSDYNNVIEFYPSELENTNDEITYSLNYGLVNYTDEYTDYGSDGTELTYEVESQLLTNPTISLNIKNTGNGQLVFTLIRNE